MQVQHKSLITKDTRTKDPKNHVLIVVVNPTNLLKVVVRALPQANPVSTAIPKITLPIFARQPQKTRVNTLIAQISYQISQPRYNQNSCSFYISIYR